MFARGRVQLRVWELQDVDEEARRFWTKTLDPEDKSNSDYLLEWDPVSEDYKAIADVGSDPVARVDSPPSSSTSIPQDDSAGLREPPPVVPLHAARNGFNRPPVFGPDKVVLDPRIKALHRQVVREVFLVGFVSAVVSSLPGYSTFGLCLSLFRFSQLLSFLCQVPTISLGPGLQIEIFIFSYMYPLCDRKWKCTSMCP